jgi:flagellar hook assembly protein FlgD
VTIPITVDYPARDATVSIYNVLGQEVYRFDRLQLSLGEHRLSWNGQSMTGQPIGSGVYIVTLNSHEHTHSEKILMLR